MNICRRVLLILYVLICAAQDIRDRRISLCLSCIVGTAGFLLCAFSGRAPGELLLAQLPALLLYLLGRLTGCIGSGDAVVLSVCGFFFSAGGIAVSLLAAVFLCGAAALLLSFRRIVSGKGLRGKGLPFAAFLALPTVFLALKGGGL